MDSKNKLEKKLDQLLKLFPEDNRNRIARSIEGPLWKQNKLGKECLKIISSISAYRIFDNHMQYFGDIGFRVTYDDLLEWMLSNSRQNSVIKTIAAVDYLVDKLNVPVTLVELLNGSNSDINYKFSNGVSFINYDTLHNDDYSKKWDFLNGNVINRPLTVPDLNFPSGILTYSFDHPICHLKGDESKVLKDINHEVTKLQTTKHCLSLIRPVEYGVFGIGTTMVPPTDLPIINKGQPWRITPSKYSPFSSKILKIEFNEADKLIVKFESLNSDFQERLKIPLEKLNNFGTRESEVDRAIELRICLESIFLNEGNKDQLRFRLALRSALFLGKDLKEKREIFSVIKKAYDITSSAVHNGKFMKNFNFNILLKAAKLARLALIKLITEEGVIWEDLELHS